MKYQLADQISFTDVDDEAVLLDLNTGLYYGLNQVGTHFLNIVKNSGAVNQIEYATKEIAEHYEISEDKVRTDLLELIEQLQQNSLLCERT